MKAKKLLGLLLSISLLASSLPIALAEEPPASTGEALHAEEQISETETEVPVATKLPDVMLPEETAGPEETLFETAFSLHAEDLSAGIDQKTETLLSFDGTLDAQVGTSPVKTGTISFAEGKNGQAAIFKTGKNYLDFQNYIQGKTSLSNKSISFSLKSAKAVPSGTDPVILANKSWITADVDQGLIFAYSWGGNNRYKIRLDDGTYDKDSHAMGRFDYDSDLFYTTGMWHDYVISYDTENNRWTLYVDGEKKQEKDTSEFAAGWQDSKEYTLKLGNDGTGKYSLNETQDYEFLVDNFRITSSVLTPEEVRFLHKTPILPEEVLTGQIEGDTTIYHGDQTIVRAYTAKFFREDGTQIAEPDNIAWNISSGEITIPDNSRGNTVVITVPGGTEQNAFTLTAVYTPEEEHAPVEAVLNVEMARAGDLPQSILDKMETRLLFEGNKEDQTGINTPTQVGAVTYEAGRAGTDQGIVFKTASGYLDFTNYTAGKTSLENKSIAFSVKSKKTVAAQTDPVILSNKNWNKNDKGFVFAHSWDGNNRYKTRIDDGTYVKDTATNGRYDYLNTVYAVNQWHDFVINFDTDNNKWSLYMDGKLLTEADTSKFVQGWQDSSLYTLKLGNDGTGTYERNATADFECVVDNFMISNTVLTPEEIKQIANCYTVDTGIKSTEIALLGAEKTAADGYYNISAYRYGKNLSEVSKLEFDVVYDPEVLTYQRIQFDNGTTVTQIEPGRLHITGSNGIPNSTVQMYSDTRMVQMVFEAVDVSVDTQTEISVENAVFYDGGGSRLWNVEAAPHNQTVMVYAKDVLDFNGDGVIGAGDIALAPADKKAAVAEVAAVYPYKRVLAVTMDGAGLCWAPNAPYNGKGLNSAGNVVQGVGLEAARNNPYCLNLFQNEMATSFSALTMDPPISAQNYCSILHGVNFKNFPSAYQFNNDIAPVKHWPDINEETPKYPSIFQVLNEKNPNRSYYANAEWAPIVNGIIEPDSGAYVEYKWNTMSFDKLAAYIKEGKFKNTAFSYLQSNLMDEYGHASGYFTDGYYKELERFDTLFPTIINAMKEADVYDDTLMIVNADHGGYNYYSNGTTKGTHTFYRYEDARNIFISVGGQTVAKGATLSGGSNDDIAALVFAALQEEKPAVMKDSAVFDSSAFLPQEELISNGRTIERVTAKEQDNKLTLSLAEVQQGNTVTAADIVIKLNGLEMPQITVPEGAAILRQELDGGLLYLTISYTETPEKLAELGFQEKLSGKARIEEMMLGTAAGKEIYCDLVNDVEPTAVEKAINSVTEASVLGNNVSADQVTGDVNLAGEQAGIPITWTSSKDTVIDSKTGFVTPLGADIKVTLTATATDGTQTKKKTFQLTVPGKKIGPAINPGGPFAYQDMAAFEAEGNSFKLENATLEKDALVTFHQDHVQVLRKAVAANSNVNLVHTFESADTFASDYYLLDFEAEQVNGAPIYISTTWPNVMTLDWQADGSIVVNAGDTKLTGMKNKRARFQVILDYTGEVMSLYVNGEEKMLNGKPHHACYDSSKKFIGGKPRTLTFNVKGSGGVVNGGIRVYGVSMSQIYTSGMAAAMELVKPRALTNQNTNSITQNLTLPQAPAGTTIAWHSTNPAVISETGVVTRPAAGDVVVILSADVSDGTSRERISYRMTVKGLNQEAPVLLRLTDAQGNTVENPGAGAAVKAVCDQSAVQSRVQLFLATYVNGALTQIKAVKGNGTGVLETETLVVPEGGTVKAMVWEADTMKPLDYIAY